MAKIDPRSLEGPWATGHALDLHSTSSEFLGYDESGRELFETKRTEVGELLYRFKYKGDAAALRSLVILLAKFVKSLDISIDLIVPVPPTRTRTTQPLYQLCRGLGGKLKLPVAETAVTKKGSSELKDVWTFEERSRILKGAITADASIVARKRVLLVDDLIRSGATLKAVTEALIEAGAAHVHVVVLTQTRRT